MSSHESLEVAPGPDERQVRAPGGKVLTVPPDWVLLPPGDPAATRRVKSAGPAWTVKEKRGRKSFSRGVWAPADRIERVLAELRVERTDPGYARKLEAGRRRRDREQAAYVESFREAVTRFLAFDERYRDLEGVMAEAITDHAAAVGSGTVARTQRIPLEQRAEAATIAWMRHQTTGYDDMKIPRVKGMRREVRRMLAEKSRRLLVGYRQGASVDPATCPLWRALSLEP